MLDPEKSMFACMEPREYRETTMGDICISREDKRRGGGPRVGPFQNAIPGSGWYALPKYDFTTNKRSSAFNERMHVEWENHLDHILSNDGELPIASVVAKAGFRSCAPCCRDMLALAGPTGKTFIMVDLAEDDRRGTYHFVTGQRYLPVPKEACTSEEIVALKRIVLLAQSNHFPSSEEIHHAVIETGAPIDELAQMLYLGDRARLPSGCATQLKGPGLIDVLHAEHFARLVAEYGASILRDGERPERERQAVLTCRALAKQWLIDAWQPHLIDADLEVYASAAVAPLLPDEPQAYLQARRSLLTGYGMPSLTRAQVEALCESAPKRQRWSKQRGSVTRASCKTDDISSLAAASTCEPDDFAFYSDADNDFE